MKKIDKWPPRYSADKAFDVIAKIYASYGKSVNTDLLAEILETTKKSSNFGKRLVALNLFGLANISNNVLTVSPLGQQIAAPVGSERNMARTQSVRQIGVLKDLLERFPGGHLPDKDSLANLLKREYEVSSESLGSWVEFVISSIKAIIPGVREIVENVNLTASQSADAILGNSSWIPERPANVLSTEVEKMMRIPLAGDRYILIPKDLKDSEAEYFDKWYVMWKMLHEQK